MNTKEKVAIIFLGVALIIGMGINLFNKYKLQRLRASSVCLELENNSLPDSALDINQATAEQLQALPGIGPVLAQRIVSYREKTGGFKSKEELLEVSGIGQKRFQAIRQLIKCTSR